MKGHDNSMCKTGKNDEHIFEGMKTDVVVFLSVNTSAVLEICPLNRKQSIALLSKY